MAHLEHVTVGVQPIERYRAILGDDGMHVLEEAAERLRRRLAGRVVWHVNSTALGGGVAELLRALLSYARGLGIDTRWAVIRGSPEFFRITKRLHHALHGARGDGVPLGSDARAVIEAVARENAGELASVVHPRDIVVLHDPQTAALAPHLLGRVGLIWRCHIGHDHPSDEAEMGWRFLRPYLEEVRAVVFSRQAYVPEWLDHGKSTIIQPTIDAFSPKNQELDDATVRSILIGVGLVEGPPSAAAPLFTRDDGTPGRVERYADILRLGRTPVASVPLVVQVSRWDTLKDPIGVMHGFARLIEGRGGGDSQLVLAGPNVHAVADDPEGAAVLDGVTAAWRALPHALRARVQLACLPTTDVQENAAIVNALQRHAAIVVQKSLREGFGLTVTEAMWKRRPVVASAVGGIQDQIVDGSHGLLLSDPADPDAFAGALDRLLGDPAESRYLGEAARERVRERFLGPHTLLGYARLIERVDGAAGS
jgi:trehalose synthase